MLGTCIRVLTILNSKGLAESPICMRVYMGNQAEAEVARLEASCLRGSH